MNIIEIQNAFKGPLPLTEEAIRVYALSPLALLKKPGEITLRITEEPEIQLLNATYRQLDKPTNVLAFPSDYPDFVELSTPYLGDIFICPTVLETESEKYHKRLDHHWAHIIIHGVLHLLGYDHINEDDAKIMQNLEIQLLETFHIDNPYLNWEEGLE